MYAVIFMDRKGAATLGTFDDKGQCRRAWRTITTGAAVVDSAGSVLEYKTGTPDAVKRKLDAHAEWMKREGKLPPASTAAPPEPPRATLRVKSLEVEVEEDEDEEDVPVTKPASQEPAPAQAPVAPAATEVLAEVKWDSAPAGPEDFRGEDYPAEGPHPIVPRRIVTAPRPAAAAEAEEHSRYIDAMAAKSIAEVTHAIAPATGAVVQGDDTERLAPPAAPVTCATKGCDRAPGIARSNVRLTWCPFCGPCRVIIRQRGRAFPGGEDAVMEHLRAGTLPPVDPHRSAYSARGGKASRGVPKAAPKPAPAPKPRRGTSPAATLAAGLETARACAEVVARLGGLGPARELAAVVEEHGGAEAVREALAAVAELGGMAA